jgi:hypothetical protein
MQVTPATRLFNYLTEFAAIRRAEPRPATGAAPAANGTVASAPAAAPGSVMVAAIGLRAAEAQQAVAPAAPAMPRLLPRGTLVNIVT